MEEYLSEASRRCLHSARTLAAERKAEQVEPADLLLGLIAEEDSRGTVLLLVHCRDEASLRHLLQQSSHTSSEQDQTAEAEENDFTKVSSDGSADLSEDLLAQRKNSQRDLSPSLRRLLVRARELSFAVAGQQEIGTEELLLAAFDVWEPARRLGLHFGFNPLNLLEDFLSRAAERSQPLNTDSPALDLSVDMEVGPRARMFDANLNRAAEGFRVVEDYVRFVLSDGNLAGLIKECRHGVKEAADFLPIAWRINERNAAGDVGAEIHTEAEGRRETLLDVAAANIKRVQEALRSLEEIAKIDNSLASRQFGKLRYSAYTIEKRLRVLHDAKSMFASDVLYWLAEPDACVKTFEWTVKEVLSAGVRLVQYREKSVDDRTRLKTAEDLRRWTNSANAKLVVNDRADIARLVGADGVHVGQEDLSIANARRIVGPDAAVGVSTHRLEEIARGVTEGAQYLGVGPVFLSQTKQFDRLAGLELVRQAAQVQLPWFAIGGVSRVNVHAVLEAGARRIAVGRAISASSEPSRAVREILSELGAL